jgi:hypothetical protein
VLTVLANIKRGDIRMGSIEYGFALLVVLFVACIAGYYKYRTELFEPQPLGFQTPILWWVLDSDTNSRKWWDFGARNSHEDNRGYVQLAQDCAEATQGSSFRIRVLRGREEVANHLAEVPEGYYQLPTAIWRDYVMSQLLATKGGLVVMGDSVLFVGPLAPSLVGVSEAVFGISANEPLSVPGSPVSPSTWMGWAAQAGTPAWTAAASIWDALVRAGPTAWTAAEARRLSMKVAQLQGEKGITHISAVEGSRKLDGSERTFADLLGSQADPADPNLVMAPGTVYVPMDGDRLLRSAEYGWFVRMSPQQILDSTFVWASLVKSCKSKHA